MENCKIVGQFTCPHVDGDFELTVYDMEGWANGTCLIRQEGQGQIHDLAIDKLEAMKLAGILLVYANS